MSLFYYAKSYRDPLIGFAVPPTQAELRAQLGSDTHVKYEIAIPLTQLQPHLEQQQLRLHRPLLGGQWGGQQQDGHHPHSNGALPIHSLLASLSSSASPSLFFRTMLAPPPTNETARKQPTRSSGGGPAKKRRYGTPLAMNADHEAVDEFVLPPPSSRTSVSHPSAFHRPPPSFPAHLHPADNYAVKRESLGGSSSSPFPSPPETIGGDHPGTPLQQQQYGGGGNFQNYPVMHQQQRPLPVQQQQRPQARPHASSSSSGRPSLPASAITSDQRSQIMLQQGANYFR
ncbi:hypothetical protein PRIPAC_93478 [Pristionchus pacificus]|uniref:Uncharacterized protein n=1 Tax=Pristionchus pacificus TaxID=54126 RepID=A0A2A6BB93_PRIPA|nr:hypothetical protein PRIPAC_93478 [Pristionchus pacificus]|eukprot:PDM63137.1 hypothetical protein PRIPAC_50352 [Pristionchus pacificus]